MPLYVANRLLSEKTMVRRKIADEYRRMNLDDQSAFRRWLVSNTVVGAISLFALIAIASIFSGGESKSVTTQKGEVILRAGVK